MAEGYLRLYAGRRAEIYSAGLEAHGLNPFAVKVMVEDGLDITGQFSKTMEQLAGKEFDIVITVCDHANENCPVFPSHTIMHHYNFPDPAKATGSDEEKLEVFRTVRDQVKQYMKAFADKDFRV